MMPFLLRRIALSFLLLYLVATTIFALIYVLPEDPARVLAGPHATRETVESIRNQLGLDRPFLQQYLGYLGRTLRGDLGSSYRTNYPVLQSLLERFPKTAMLAAGAILIEILIGIPLGIIAALKKNTILDWGTMAGALVGISFPTFWLGIVLMYLLGFKAGLFPIGGYSNGGLDTLQHLVLPSLTLGITGAAYYSRLMRTEFLENKNLDYVRTAEAKGLPRSKVLFKHILRNSLIPVVTLFGLDLGVLLGGAVITESIFSWPGIGQLAIQGIFQMDVPVIMGTVTFAAALIIAANILVDLSYSFLDPRIRLG